MDHVAFVGRDNELEKLKSLLRKKTASLVVIRGRRRIGKSRLVEEFAKDLTSYAFSGLAPVDKTSAKLQREEFARQLQEQLGIPGLKADDWGDLFTILAKFTAHGRVVVLFDEISWMGSFDPTFLGKLKIAWDMHFKKNPQLILILCGSVSSWIEKNIISSTGFFGRISQKIFLQDLSLSSCNKMLLEVGFKGSVTEKIMLLSITGGVPWYLELINPDFSAIENIKKLFFEKDAVLLDEFKQIFHDLFKKRGDIYQKIVSCLVQGPREYQEIAKYLNYASGGPLSDYLNELIMSGYIGKYNNWSIKTGKEMALVKYRLCDNYLRFYLKNVLPNYSKIQKGHFEDQTIADFLGWNSVTGYQFENLVLCNRSLIQKKLNISRYDIVNDNPFFQHTTTKQKGCQIDYLIQTRYRTLYVCEIKFTNREIGSSVISEVQQKIERLNYPKGFSCLPVLIHVNGVSDRIKQSDYFIELIDFSEIMEAF